MKSQEEKRWERMQRMLLAEAGGSSEPRISSTRTLFGIKSHVEQVMDAVAAEDTAINSARARGVSIVPYSPDNAEQARLIWNDVVEGGRAFPQEETLDPCQAKAFFESQTFTGVAVKDGEVVGMYILHPNDEGRKSHISNASYAVKKDSRGSGIGQALVTHSLGKAKEAGFRGLQFNAVVASNASAIHVYEKLGFKRIGTIPGGYRNKSGAYEDMHIYFHNLA